MLVKSGVKPEAGPNPLSTSCHRSSHLGSADPPFPPYKPLTQNRKGLHNWVHPDPRLLAVPAGFLLDLLVSWPSLPLWLHSLLYLLAPEPELTLFSARYCGFLISWLVLRPCSQIDFLAYPWILLAPPESGQHLDPWVHTGLATHDLAWHSWTSMCTPELHTGVRWGFTAWNPLLHLGTPIVPLGRTEWLILLRYSRVNIFTRFFPHNNLPAPDLALQGLGCRGT